MTISILTVRGTLAGDQPCCGSPHYSHTHHRHTHHRQTHRSQAREKH